MSARFCVFDYIQNVGTEGATAFEVIDFLGEDSLIQPSSVYSVLSVLLKEGKILDSTKRRRSPKGRRSIVWWDAKYGGQVPVWQEGHPQYRYRGRTKQVIDVLAKHDGLTLGGICCSQGFDRDDHASVSSLLCQLRRQGWVRNLPEKRDGMLVWVLTERGRQVRGEKT